MNVVSSGGRFQIYSDNVKTSQFLPVGTYDVEFNKMTGFYLTARKDIAAPEEKIYGSHSRRVEKVMRSYIASSRNFGVILSGQKGIGKSVFAKLLAAEGIRHGYPVLIVSSYVPGIGNFLSSIEQDTIVLFDEFEKTFGKTEEVDPQEEMLTLFDGFDGGHRLFIITCNDPYKLNDCLINRPGRFHYHFNLGSPTDEEITAYLMDNLLPRYHDVIKRIIHFAHTVDVTYDYLRAIVFELNQGYSVEETLNELNLTRTRDVMFDIVLYFEDGTEYTAYSTRIDLYSNQNASFWVNNLKDRHWVKFNPKDVCIMDGELCVPKEKIILERDTEEDWELSDEEKAKRNEEYKRFKPARLTLEKVNSSILNRYTV